MTQAEKDTNVTVEMGKPEKPTEPKRGGLTRFEDIERDLEGLFENFMSRNWLRPLRDMPSLRSVTQGRDPRMDVVERDAEILVRAELPGVEKDDIDVSLTDRSVTIKATTRTEKKDEKGDYYRHEISTGQLSRTVLLPAEVDGEKATAEFKNGLLEITIPKVPAANRIRIDVK